MSASARRLAGSWAARWARRLLQTPQTAVDSLPGATAGSCGRLIRSHCSTTTDTGMLLGKSGTSFDWMQRCQSPPYRAIQSIADATPGERLRKEPRGRTLVVGESRHCQSRGYAGRPLNRHNEEPDKKANRLNQEIKASVVRLVSDDGHEVMPLHEALNKAKQEGLDLVEVASPSGSEAPVVRIMDYARKQFEQRKKMKDQKKTKVVSRRLSVQKEVQLRPRIGDHDLDVKMAQAEKHLEKGYKVRFLVNLRKPNERDAGQQILDKVKERMEPLAKVLDQGDKKPHPVMIDLLMMPLPQTIKQSEAT